MPTAPVTYHWESGSSIVINPEINTLYYSDIILPAKHTLRRIMLPEPMCFWKRSSVSFDDQQAYFVSYQVEYGYVENPPILHRAICRMEQVIAVDPTAAVDVYNSIHSGAYNELGFNVRTARGGFYSEANRVRMAWSIGSSGSGGERLVGQANMTMFALYSLPIAP